MVLECFPEERRYLFVENSLYNIFSGIIYSIEEFLREKIYKTKSTILPWKF